MCARGARAADHRIARISDVKPSTSAPATVPGRGSLALEAHMIGRVRGSKNFGAASWEPIQHLVRVLAVDHREHVPHSHLLHDR